MISTVFITLAAIFNAMMDAFENENFYESIFKKLNERFWYKRISWKYARKIGGYKVDAWHLAKSAMVVCLCFAVALHDQLLPWYLEVLLYGAIWNLVFVLFYHKIFRIK